MNVCVQPPQPALSRSLQRVADALARTAPPYMTLVARREDADLTIYHIISHVQQALLDEDRAGGRPYAIVQCCLETAGADLLMWVPYWERALGVWSYLDLHSALSHRVGDDPMQAGTRAMWSQINFHFAPLGVDRNVFKPPSDPKAHRPFLLATTGYVAESESLRECADAVRFLGGRMLHLGSRDLHLGDHVTCVEGITDAQWATYLGQSQFVAGLRRVEGFELPLLEGAACGATPITFDLPCYTQWFSGLAEFIPAWDSKQVTKLIESRLIPSLRRTQDVLDYYLAPFDWDTVTRGFWRSLGI